MNDNIELPPPISPAAERMRRTRDRRRRGMLPVSILLHQSEVAGLVRRNLLTPEATRDKVAIRRAFHEWLGTGVLR